MKILSVVGARPQFVKLAVMHPSIVSKHEHCIVHTGQHYDYQMSQTFFEELDIPDPDHNLGVGSGSHGAMTGKALEAIEKVLMEERPDIVLVYGDTNSTLAASLAAVKLHIKLAHVEAGLRSFCKAIPEEVNRIVTDHVSDVLFCPSVTSVRNLRNEGITKGVFNTGDVMIEGLIKVTPKLKLDILNKYSLEPGRYVLSTIHRQENADFREKMAEIIGAMIDYDGRIILPLHPRTMKNLAAWGMIDRLRSAANVTVTEPLGFLEFASLEKNAKAILTDSGGIQKEAYFYNVRCITTRDETEWTETLEGGWNVLVKADRNEILKALTSPVPTSVKGSPYGDENVSKNIVKILENEFRK